MMYFASAFLGLLVVASCPVRSWMNNLCAIQPVRQTKMTITKGTFHSQRSKRKELVSALQLGLWDNVVSKFLQDRDGDFIKLDHDDSQLVGPGPLLVLFYVPRGIDDDEIMDMIHDGAPRAYASNPAFQLARLDNFNLHLPEFRIILESPCNEALEMLISMKSTTKMTEPSPVQSNSGYESEMVTTPVLLFSGFYNSEMMNVYNLLGKEIYQENQQTAACAKVVPNSMHKPLRQILEEICGDHKDAMRIQQDEAIGVEES